MMLWWEDFVLFFVLLYEDLLCVENDLMLFVFVCDWYVFYVWFLGGWFVVDWCQLFVV